MGLIKSKIEKTWIRDISCAYRGWRGVAQTSERETEMLWTEDGKKGSEGMHWKVKWFLCFTSKH